MHLHDKKNAVNRQQPILITGHRTLSDQVRRYLRQGLLAVFLSAVSVVSLMAAPLQLPAIGSMPGIPNHFQMICTRYSPGRTTKPGTSRARRM